uniref:Saposin B-type domain-containing protein n=1 Tax=Panagrellus redivivus TaxID=6233 RepID=A0A7E4UXJ7_PANRE
MNTAVVFVFAALAVAVLATSVPCWDCQDAVFKIRTDLGNNGRDASVKAVAAALKKDCEHRFSLYLEKCYNGSVIEASAVKVLLDKGASEYEICIGTSRCYGFFGNENANLSK